MGLIHGRSFQFQKLVPKRPGACTRCGLLLEVIGILLVDLGSDIQSDFIRVWDRGIPSRESL